MNIKYVLDDGYITERLLKISKSLSLMKDIVQYREELLEISSYINQELGLPLFIASDYNQNKIGNNYIYNYLCSPEKTEYRDIFLSLYVQLERYTKYDLLEEELFNEEIFNLDGFSASSYIQNIHAALITDRPVIETSWWDIEKHYKCLTTKEAKFAYRDSFYKSSPSYDQAFGLREILWPNCYFHVGTERFSKLSVAESQYCKAIFSYFDYLNDQVQNDFIQFDDTSAFIKNASVLNIELSPESPNTRANSKAMREREISIDNITICCEWHLKLAYNKGRIHVHFNIPEIKELKEYIKGRVIIGIFAGHLTT